MTLDGATKDDRGEGPSDETDEIDPEAAPNCPTQAPQDARTRRHPPPHRPPPDHLPRVPSAHPRPTPHHRASPTQPAYRRRRTIVARTTPTTPTRLILRLSPNVIARKRRSSVAGGIKPITGPRVISSRAFPAGRRLPRSSPSSEPTTRPARTTRMTSPIPRWAAIGQRAQVTISGLASVTTRVCFAMLLRMNFGRLNACWWVTPSQYSSVPLIRSAISLSIAFASCLLGSTFFEATMNPHAVPKHDTNVW